ncbi:MAG TPA: prolyl oligopeptidase family serine peptidase, partial [Chitinophagaceae bacterium]|nr:prolyl oligopeptidase family serine peptidase [Chitinophagaceae bacterium]
LYKFPDPGYSEDRINIPWFVSRGYLVFCPDIYYTKGKTGKSALNSVVAAAKLLSSLPFVDKEKIGIQGHSFGGFETNYIISHTNIFRAACSAAGLSNMVSFYGSQWGSFMETQYYVESLQMHLGTTLWQNQKVYLENSPVLNADRVTTPVLFMANKKDDYCFYQQVEFFNGLRRLNKSSWLLQYDNGAHSVYGDDAFDFTKRMEQFFDHYLEGKLPPKWMTRGIEAKLKYSETGFELDSVMSCSNNCQVCSRIHNRQLNINQVNGN